MRRICQLSVDHRRDNWTFPVAKPLYRPSFAFATHSDVIRDVNPGRKRLNGVDRSGVCLYLAFTAVVCPWLAHIAAPLAELVDAPDSKSGSERSAGSIPAGGTITKINAKKTAPMTLSGWSYGCVYRAKYFAKPATAKTAMTNPRSWSVVGRPSTFPFNSFTSEDATDLRFSSMRARNTLISMRFDSSLDIPVSMPSNVPPPSPDFNGPSGERTN